MSEHKVADARADAESFVLGYVHPGQVSAQFMQSVMDLFIADENRGSRSRLVRRGAILAVGSGPRIASARNDVVRGFLRTSAEWLLMVDTDMVFTPADVDALFQVADPVERPLVGGLCFGGGRAGIVFPTLYVLQPPIDGAPPVRVVENYPDDALCRVDATGAAFLLGHRSVYEPMGEHYGEPAPWFVEGTVYHGLSFGEDWAFCMRAKDMGVPLYVHTGVKIGHMKAQVLDERSFRIQQIENEARREHEERNRLVVPKLVVGA